MEAKKLTVGPQNVLTQAERYSRGVQQQPRYQGEYGVPFLYSTNGEQIWFHDVRREQNRSRWVAGFHTPLALAEMLKRDFDAELTALSALEPNAMLRPYQVQANEAIEQMIRDGKRKMLVTMATGTGKTLMSVNEIYRLMKSGVAQRVLFLVDRRALAAQTVRAFASFEAEPGLKFDKIYPVYSQRLQPVRLRRRAVRPERDAGFAADRTQARRCVRLRLHDPADDDQPLRRREGGDDRRRVRGRRRRSARHSHPRFRPDRRGRVPPRLFGAGPVDLAQDARPLRRDQDRPDRDAGRAHDGLLREPRLPLRVRATPFARAISSTTTSSAFSPTCA